MIQLFYNGAGYEMYVNGVFVSTISIRVDSDMINGTRATLTAFVQIVNEKPVKK